MSFLTIVIILLVFVIAALLGIGVAFLLLRPKGHNFFQTKASIQIITFIAVSLFLFSLLFGGSTFYRASAYYRVAQYQFEGSEGVIQTGSVISQYAEEWKNNKSAITTEIWLQQMMLPSRDAHCYTGNNSICDLFTNVGISVASRWNSYLIFLGLGLTGVFAFLFYSIWITKLRNEEANLTEKEPRPRPKSRARR
jgi:hypothetical protein